MQFCKFIFLGAILAVAAPFAVADTLSGELVIKGTGTLTASSLSFSPTSGQVKTTGTDAFSAFTATTPGNYTTLDLTLFPLNVAETGQAFYTIVEGGETLTLYFSELNSITIGSASPAKTGAFKGTGYVTLTGVTGVAPVSYSFLDTTTGSGSKIFTITIDATAPEPGSLALLGTGMLGLTGIVRRRLRAI